jgi:hypothetical protein
MIIYRFKKKPILFFRKLASDVEVYIMACDINAAPCGTECFGSV